MSQFKFRNWVVAQPWFSNSSSVFCEQEEQNRGKPNWEHLSEDLHVLITVEDSQNRAEIKLKRAIEEVKKLLVPAVSDLFLFVL